ncbi:MAG: chromosome segregation protein SMC [Armatimonadetes bacterium]|nr:chromosome segregation protein SMC [Armatimonadota bacterium]
MNLKRVKIYGFKTFADKTEFEIDGNIISIIGPNGCGKSNIVDAILWGLGETNARNLRAQTAKDVIFNGSGTRKAVGYAEVTLVFDNEDGTLPIEGAEVSVTRRLTRSGESDYFINKRPCRLRDVSDLLADSGLGRAGYAIVSQSDIDQALSASAVQRRAWIDEAAGVQRYRVRRTEALRRLESTEEHLQRVHDIITEIETQRAPLAEEAEIAKRYKAALGGLREVESSLLRRELADSIKEVEELETRIDSVMKLSEDDALKADRLERLAAETFTKANDLDIKIEGLREQQQAAQSRWEQASAAAQIAQHKLESLDNLQSTLSEEVKHSGEQLAEAEKAVAETSAEEARERENLQRLETELSGADGEAKQLAAALKDLERQVEAARKIVAERQKWEVELAHRESRIKQLRKEIAGIVNTLPDLAEGIAEAEKLHGEADAKVNEAKSAMEALEREEQDERKARETFDQSNRKLLAQIAALDGKRRGIEATIDAHEGLAQGARAVMLAANQGRLEPVYTPVGESIVVDSDLALAFDTALGGAANDLIVPDDRFAKKAIDFLKQNRLGRATFQPLNFMRPNVVTQDLRDLLRKPGVVGLASELVDCDPQNRPVIDSLLGRVVITEDLDSALALAKTRGWSRMVTMDGELLHSSGAVTGGATTKQGTGLVQRKAELAEIEEELLDLQKELEKLQKASSGDESRVLNRQAKREQLRAALVEARTERDDHHTWLMGLRHEQVTTVNSQKRLEDELAKLSTAPTVQADEVDLPALEAARDQALRRLAEKSTDANGAQARLQEASERLQQAVHRAKEAARRLSNLQEAENNRSRRVENLEPEREKYRAQITEATALLEQTAAEVQSLREKIMAEIVTRKNLTEEAQKLAEEARAAQKAASGNAEILHQAEIKRARADSKRSVALERLLEEYGIDLEAALDGVDDLEIPEDAAALVAKLRRDLKQMGDVNLGAIEAYERLTERYDELHGQTEDIEAGIRELRSTVRSLDQLTRERFMATFSQLQVAFAEVFVRLLGGGEASLELTEAENVLDSGVEISVTIPGKRRQRLELLSGGERAMSALAFLFSLLQVKPSPLVILDEVDAPLDGRNVERFISMMRAFNDQSQFILITHNPVTIESADIWFGVTMQEPGVSTLVPFKAPTKSVDPAVAANVSLKG